MKNKSQRFLSIDVFRGLTVALMLLVNCMDGPSFYPVLAHSIWHGCTMADVVFPFFLFIVGISSALSISNGRAKGHASSDLAFKIARRSVVLFVIGLLLNVFPNHFDLSHVRIPGVMQRIAICYFFSAILFLTIRIRTQAFIAGCILILYWFFMTHVPSPGFKAGDLSIEGNLAAYLDGFLIPSNHLYKPNFDPEGILSTFPAVATTLLGNLFGAYLSKQGGSLNQSFRFYLVGMVFAATGWYWGLVFPLNKALWTSSYVLWSVGLAMIVYATIHWMIERNDRQKWLKPFEMLGTNAMAAFIMHVVFLKFQMISFRYFDSRHLINLKAYLMHLMFGWAPIKQATLYYGLFLTVFWVCSILYFDYLKRMVKDREAPSLAIIKKEIRG